MRIAEKGSGDHCPRASSTRDSALRTRPGDCCSRRVATPGCIDRLASAPFRARFLPSEIVPVESEKAYF